MQIAPHQLRPSSEWSAPDHIVDLLRARYVPDSMASQDIRQFIGKERQSLPHDTQDGVIPNMLCKALLAPIRRLPPEILEKVFSYAEAPKTTPEFERAPVLWLAAVCKVWRDVAVGSFDLTTRITLPLKARSTSSPISSTAQSRLDSLQAFLQTYPYSPLHVQLHFGPPETISRRSFRADRSTGLETYIPLMMQHGRRWCKLDVLDKDRYDVVPPIRQFLNLVFNQAVIPTNANADGVPAASKIRDLVLFTPSYADFIPRPNIHDDAETPSDTDTTSITYTNPYNLPWTTLSSLSLRCAAQSISHLLDLCTSLEKFNAFIDLTLDTDFQIPTSNTIAKTTSSTLKELGMTFTPYCGPNVLPHLLSTISLPALSSLSLRSNMDNTHGGNILPSSILRSFLSQSPNLHRLELSSVPITGKSAVESLSGAPNLHELICDFTAIRDLDRLAEGLCLTPTPKDDAQALVPSLTSINLGVMQQSTTIRVSSIVRSRAHRAKASKLEHRTAALRKVTLVPWNTSYSWVRDLAKELEGLGLEEVRIVAQDDGAGGGGSMGERYLP